MPDKTTADKLIELIDKFGCDKQAILSGIEDLQERQAIVDSNPTERTLKEIEALESRSRTILATAERFPGEHYCARTLIEQDIPRWKAKLHANGRHFRRVLA